jgi:hypothetical protein
MVTETNTEDVLSNLMFRSHQLNEESYQRFLEQGEVYRKLALDKWMFSASDSEPDGEGSED